MYFSSTVSCTRPSVPKNGFLDEVTSTTIMFGCNEGYSPQGTMTAECVATDTWSPDPAQLECTITNGMSQRWICLQLQFTYSSLGNTWRIMFCLHNNEAMYQQTMSTLCCLFVVVFFKSTLIATSIQFYYSSSVYIILLHGNDGMT